MLFWLARPTASSVTITGSPRITRKTRYTSTKAAPPYWPTMYGKRHTFPSPMAHPAETRINPSRDSNVSRSFKSSPLFYFFSENKKKDRQTPILFLIFPVLYFNAPTLLCQRFYVAEFDGLKS